MKPVHAEAYGHMGWRLASLGLAFIFAACQRGQLPQEGKPTVNPIPFRSFCYTDWINEYKVNPAPMKPAYLDLLVQEAATGGADVLVVNPNGQTTAYPSKVWQTMWGKYAAGNTDVFGTVPATETGHYRAMLEQMLTLERTGCDYLQRFRAACARAGITFGVSVRMNDIHSTEHGRNFLVSDFYYDHPEWRHKAHGNEFLNYAVPEVRAHFLALITEIVKEYRPAVLDLDFSRNPYCVPQDHTDPCGVMTAFLRAVRTITQAAEPPVPLMALVPGASVRTAKDHGFDMAQWAQEGLIDGVVPKGLLHSSWHGPIAEFRAALGTEIALYGGAEYFADTRERLLWRRLPAEPLLMRGFAAAQFAQGADGVYWYNFAIVRQSKTPGLMTRPPHRDQVRPCFEQIGECAGPEHLRLLPKTYLVPAQSHFHTSAEPPSPLPVDLASGESFTFELDMLVPLAGARVELACVVRSAAAASAMKLTFVNGEEINRSIAFRENTQDDARTGLAAVPAERLQEGKNSFAVLNGGPPLRMVSVEVTVTAPKEEADKGRA